MISTVGLVLLALAVAWRLGGVLLRAGGAVVASVGAIALVVTGSPDGLVLVFTGTALWAAGRVHHRFRHGPQRSADRSG